MSLTQYLESQEDQDITRLLYFTRTQKGENEGVSLSWNGGDEALYSDGGETMNKRAFNEG